MTSALQYHAMHLFSQAHLFITTAQQYAVMAGPLSHCCCEGRDLSSKEEILTPDWFSDLKIQFLYQLVQLNRTAEHQWKLRRYKKALVKDVETSSSVWCPVSLLACILPSRKRKGSRKLRCEHLSKKWVAGLLSCTRASSKPAHFTILKRWVVITKLE